MFSRTAHECQLDTLQDFPTVDGIDA